MTAKVSNEQRKTPGRKKTSQITKNVFRDRLNKSIAKKNILTNEDLGKALGISTAQAGKYRNGSIPDPDMLKTISEKFDTSIDYLLGISDDHHRDTNAGDYLGISGDSVEALKNTISRLKTQWIISDYEAAIRSEILNSILQSREILSAMVDIIEDKIAYNDAQIIKDKQIEFLGNKASASYRQRADAYFTDEIDDGRAYSEFNFSRKILRRVNDISAEIHSFFDQEDLNDIAAAGSVNELADIINTIKVKALFSAISKSDVIPDSLMHDYFEDLTRLVEGEMEKLHDAGLIHYSREITDSDDESDDDLFEDEEFPDVYIKHIDDLNEDERMDSEDE